MSERSIHPRTRADHQMWRLRDLERKRSKNARSSRNRSENKTAIVTAIDEATGEIQLDQFTDQDGNGQWFSPVNGVTPPVGSGVIYAHVDGVPVVMGAGDGGIFQRRLDDDMIELPDFPGGEYSGYPGQPIITIDPGAYAMQFGQPPSYDPHFMWWNSHFGADDPYYYEGVGSESRQNYHTLRVSSGATQGNLRRLIVQDGSVVPLVRARWAAEITIRVKLVAYGNAAIRFGFMSDLGVATPNDGIYWEMDNVSDNEWACRIQKAGAIEDWVYGTTPMAPDNTDFWFLRIGFYPVEVDAFGQDMVIYFERWKSTAKDEDGYYVPASTYRYEDDPTLVSDGYFYYKTWSDQATFANGFNAGISIRTANNTAKSFDVDYLGGWAWILP
jgi:hypothetical protein